MTTLLVTTNADSGDGSLRQAINDAAAGDSIALDTTAFAEGTTATILAGSQILITKELQLLGSTWVDETTGVKTYRIVIDGQSGSGGATRLLNVSSDDADLTVVGVKFQNAAPSSGAGGAVSIARGVATFTDCAFVDNASVSNGGALNVTTTTSGTSFNNCVFDGNSAGANSGVAYVTGATAAFNECVFKNNSATSAAGAFYLYQDTSSIVCTDCEFANNTGATTSTIALYRASQCVLTRCSITGSCATGSSGAMVAVNSNSTSSGLLTLNATTISMTSGYSALTLAGAAPVTIIGLNVVAKAVLNSDQTWTFDSGGALGIAEFSPQSYTMQLAGNGYLATPPSVSMENASVATGANVRLCQYGAGVTTFDATAVDVSTVVIKGTQTDSTIPALLEYQAVANATDGGWSTFDDDFVLSSEGTSMTAPITGRLLYRVYDGAAFHVDAAWSGTRLGVQFSVIAQIVASTEEIQNWQCVYKVIGVDSDNLIRAGQAITILARVYDAFDNDAPLLNDGNNVASIAYTCEKKVKEVYSTVWKAVDGHENVEVDSSALLETVETSDAWDEESGFNFSLTPDVTQKPLFPDVGAYRIVVTISLTEGNPVVFYVYIDVTDSN